MELLDTTTSGSCQNLYVAAQPVKYCKLAAMAKQNELMDKAEDVADQVKLGSVRNPTVSIFVIKYDAYHCNFTKFLFHPTTSSLQSQHLMQRILCLTYVL